MHMQVSGLQPNPSGSKGARAQQLSRKAPNVWSRCIVPFDRDRAVNKADDGRLREQDIVPHCQVQLSSSRWLPEYSERPEVESLDDYRQMMQTFEASRDQTAQKTDNHRSTTHMLKTIVLRSLQTSIS